MTDETKLRGIMLTGVCEKTLRCADRINRDSFELSIA